VATDLAGQYTAATAATFANRCEMALVQQIVAIAQEDPATPSHDERVLIAQKATVDTATFVRRCCFLLAAQGLDNTADDTTLVNALKALIDAVAIVVP
jgi:hypothetical protein